MRRECRVREELYGVPVVLVRGIAQELGARPRAAPFYMCARVGRGWALPLAENVGVRVSAFFFSLFPLLSFLSPLFSLRGSA